MEGCTTFFYATKDYRTQLKADFLGDVIAFTTTVAAIIIQDGIVTPVQVMRLIGIVFKMVEKLTHPKCTDNEADYEALKTEFTPEAMMILASLENAADALKNSEGSRLAAHPGNKQ